MIEKKVFFENQNHKKLAGILVYKSGLQNRVSLIVCHGFSGSKEGGGRAIEMAKYFATHQIPTLLFDFSGNGESEGDFSDITLSGQIKDLDAAIEYMYSMGTKRIFIMGRSFGGTTAICYQGFRKNKNIIGVIGVNSVAYPYKLFSKFVVRESLKNSEIPSEPIQFNCSTFSGIQEGEALLDATNLIKLKSENGELVVKKSFFDDLKKWDVCKMASNISPTPLLIIHGEKDELVSVKEGIDLFKHANEPKKLKIIPNGDHTLSKNYKEMWDSSLNFMKSENL